MHLLEVNETFHARFIAFVCERHVFQQQWHKWDHWRLQLSHRHSAKFVEVDHKQRDEKEKEKSNFTWQFHQSNFNLNYSYVEHAASRSLKLTEILHRSRADNEACR